MKNYTAINLSISSNTHSHFERMFAKLFFLTAMVFLFAVNGRAQTWSSSPGTNDWNTAGNWSSPSLVPNAQSAIAAFSTSGTTGLSLGSGVSVSGIQFNSGASAFVVNTNSNELAFFGSGIVNNSSALQNLVIGAGGESDFYNTSTSGNANLTNDHILNFNNNAMAGSGVISNEVGATINFSNNATAGSAAIFNNFSSSTINFNNNSTAGSSTITNVGLVVFNQNATAGSATITNSLDFYFEGSSIAGNSNIVNNGYLNFYNNSSAEAATITNGATGNFNFFNNSTAGNSAITNASGGGVTFYDDSTAGNSDITNSGILSFRGQGNGVSFSTAGSATITNYSKIFFNDYSTAGNSTITNAIGGAIAFNDDSTASNSNMTNNGNLVFSGQGNGVSFSTAGSATITNNNSLSFNDYSTAGNSQITNTNLSFINFFSNSNAGTATIVNSVGGNLRFFGNSSTESASITNANGGAFDFLDNATAGNSTITNNGNLAFTGQGNGVSFSTAGSATITNNNVMSFNDYSTAGNSTITNAVNGTFDFNGNSTAGNSQITNNGSLSFNGLAGDVVNFSTAANSAITNNGTIYFGNYCTGANASITNNGTGILSLTQNSTMGNASIINANGGAITFNDESTAGNSLILNNGDLAFSGLSGTNFSTAGNSLIMNNNSLIFDSYSTAGNATIHNNMNFDFFGAATAGNANVINNLNLNFYNDSTAGNATIMNNSGIQFQGSTTAGNSNITNNNTGDIIFFDSASAGSADISNKNLITFEQISTAGNADINNYDFINFFNSSSGGNANINNTGYVSFVNASTAGNSTITTNNGGWVHFENSASGDTARLIFNGTGYLDISNETTGTAVTIGSIEGSGSVSLGANNLTTGSNNSGTSYSGIVADGGFNGGAGGSLTKIGTGTFTLSGANSYTGGTDIDGGTLVAANSSALGTGSVAVNGGILSLSGPRTLNIVGNYTQTSAGILQLGLGGTLTGQWDNLNIAGTSTLGGTLNLVSYNGFHLRGGETFELLDSTSGLSGQFGKIVDLVYEPVSIVYTPNEVILDALTFSQFALTINEKNVAGSIDNLSENIEDITLLNALTALPTAALPSTYDEISPSNLTPIYKMRFMDSQAQGGFVWWRLSEIFGNESSNSAIMSWNGESPMFAGNMPADQEVQIAKGLQPDPWGGFLSGMNNFGAVTSDGNGAAYQFSILGTTAGADYRLAKDLAGGLLIGYDQSGSNQSTGTVNVTGTQVGLYAGWKSDDFHIDAFIDGGIDSYSTQRTAFGGTANGSTSGLEYAGQLNLGYDLWVSDYDVNLFLSGQLTQVNVNGFNETGSLAPLTFSNQGEAYLDSDLGFQLSHDWQMGKMKLSPSLNAAWEHVYQGNLDSLTANFGTGNNFAVLGSDTGTDAAVLGAGLNAEFSGGFSVYLDYQGKLGMTNFSEQSLSGGINVAFGGSKFKEIHATVKPAATPLATPVVILPPLPKPTVSPLPSPVATPVVIVTPVVSPVETPFSLGPLVPTQGIITILTPTATPLPPGSMISPLKAKGM